MNVDRMKTSILEFLADEGLDDSLKLFDSEDNFQIKINDPFIEDDKQRLGISIQYFDDGDCEVVFQGFKSVGNLGDDYHGSFWKFIRLYKEFNSNKEAYTWFIKNYLFKNLKNLEFKSKEAPKEEEEEIELILPKGSEKINENHVDATNYLFRRGIETNYSNNIYVLKEEKRIIFPVYENGKLIYYAGRSYNPRTTLRWKNASVKGLAPIWNLENINGDIVYIFEGIFDAILVPQAVALFGSNNIGKHYYEKILAKNFSRINLVFDNDEPGYHAKYKLAEILAKKHKNIYIYNWKGIKEKDFSEMYANKTKWDFENRLIKWNLQADIKIKMGLIK